MTETEQADQLANVTVNGRKPSLRQVEVESNSPTAGKWFAWCNADDMWILMLTTSGEWSRKRGAVYFYGETREAAFAHCLAHADKPASVSDTCIKSFDCANGTHSDACPLATAPPPTTYDLPTHPGRWKREEGKWELLVSGQPGWLHFTGFSRHGINSGCLHESQLWDDFPHGHWHPAGDDDEVERLRGDRQQLRSQIDGVIGALADGGGDDILAIRVDGDYGASVRQVVEQRDALRQQLSSRSFYQLEIQNSDGIWEPLSVEVPCESKSNGEVSEWWIAAEKYHADQPMRLAQVVKQTLYERAATGHTPIHHHQQ